MKGIYGEHIPGQQIRSLCASLLIVTVRHNEYYTIVRVKEMDTETLISGISINQSLRKVPLCHSSGSGRTTLIEN